MADRSPVAPIEPSIADEALLRGSDDLLVDFDRGFRMFQEFVGGCRSLFDIGLAVSVFGSARFSEDHPYYRLARDLGRELARRGYAVVTGGGAGRFAASSRRARRASVMWPCRNSRSVQRELMGRCVQSVRRKTFSRGCRR